MFVFSPTSSDPAGARRAGRLPAKDVHFQVQTPCRSQRGPHLSDFGEKASGEPRARTNTSASPGGIVPPVSKRTPVGIVRGAGQRGARVPRSKRRGRAKLGGEGRKGVKGAAIPELLRPALIQSPAGRQAHSNVTNHAGAIPGSLLPDQDQGQHRATGRSFFAP